MSRATLRGSLAGTIQSRRLLILRLSACQALRKKHQEEWAEMKERHRKWRETDAFGKSAPNLTLLPHCCFVAYTAADLS